MKIYGECGVRLLFRRDLYRRAYAAPLADSNCDVADLTNVFGTMAALQRKLARRQQDNIAVLPVNLRLKKEIRREPFGLRRIDATVLITKLKPCGRGLTVGVVDG